ncbi:MAG: hypothetical protein NTV58_09170 [Deltaproteobacteria bacterium]|nr:hypothetical protein [Deltaproteobacteria bacterium]
MPQLEYVPELFAHYWGVPLTQPSEIYFTWDELCKSAITVGRRNWNDVLQHGKCSVLEILWRLAMLRANLVEDHIGNLQPSNAFTVLDRSEKGAVSFFLGMCFTKLLVEKLFGVPWLLHLDVYRASLNPHLAFNTRPDFVGLDAHQQWIVVESKGRSWSLPNDTMEKAKLQTRSLRNINGQLPALKVAIGSHFSANGIMAKVWDPEEYDENAEDIEIDTERLVRAYYRPLVEYVRLLPSFPLLEGQVQNNRQDVELSGLDAKIAIDGDILVWYDSNNHFWDSIIATNVAVEDSVLSEVAAFKRDSVPELEAPGIIDLLLYEEPLEMEILPFDLDRQEKIKNLVEKQRSSDICQAIDGVKVELGESWSTEYMRRQPQDRKS